MASSDIVQYKTPARKARQHSYRGLFNNLPHLDATDFCDDVRFIFQRSVGGFQTSTNWDWAWVSLCFLISPTFRHYENLFLDKNFGKYMMNSIISAGGSALISVVLGSMCAYALSRTEFRGKKDLLFWIISTRMAPVVAVMVPLYAIFRNFELVGTLPGLILAYTHIQPSVCNLDFKGLL